MRYAETSDFCILNTQGRSVGRKIDPNALQLTSQVFQSSLMIIFLLLILILCNIDAALYFYSFLLVKLNILKIPSSSYPFIITIISDIYSKL